MDNLHQRDSIEILLEQAKAGKVSRRKFVKAMAMLAALPAGMRAGVSFAQNKQLVVVNWGGDSIESYRKAWADEFSRKSGIPVKIDGSGPTDGAIRTQAASGHPSWDIVDAEPFTSLTLGRAGICQPLDYSIIDKSKVAPGFAQQYGVASYLYSYVIAWDSQRFGSKGPRNWADFFNVQAFPGKRTMYKWMNGMLEAALLADGVAPAALYPLDVPRALRKLDELKPHVIGYWGSGAESQQFMVNGDASVGAIWNTRAMLLEQDTDNRIKWGYDNAFVTPSTWAVLKNNPGGTAAAMQFIASAQDPKSQVELFKMTNNSPANPAAQALIPADLRARNCAAPENLAKQMRLNIEWYADNYASALEQYLKHIAR